MNQVVLSLFPGADLLGRAFEEQGFTVVKGPDKIWNGDIREFKGVSGCFHGIIGGPPCTAHSQAIQSRGGSGASLDGNLIPEFTRVVKECKPKWWVMENVPEAPEPELDDLLYKEVLEALHYGSRSRRKRRFCSNLALEPKALPEEDWDPDPWPVITATEYKVSPGSNERVMRQRAGRKVGRKLTLKEMKDAMGVPSDWDFPCLLQKYQYIVLGNGVPLPLGRAVAKAVKETQ